MFISSAFIILLVIAAIWNATNRLIGKARENAEKKEELYTQLLHACKMASLGELATGVAHEINNPLAIIIATTGVIKDRFNPEFNLDNNPEAILGPRQKIITHLACFWPVYRITSTNTYLDMRRRMSLVDEPKSCAILCNYFSLRPLNPAIMSACQLQTPAKEWTSRPARECASLFSRPNCTAADWEWPPFTEWSRNKAVGCRFRASRAAVRP